MVAGDEHAAAIARRLAEILGIGEGVGAAEETPWAIRRFLEILAAERPLVAVWEDIHWAEPAFLDVRESRRGLVARRADHDALHRSSRSSSTRGRTGAAAS